ncbi:hypothetical protein KM043_008881 [Ampulex compressa]|nr:hypothetical protein KM043_008881 [Ampulex compressa]
MEQLDIARLILNLYLVYVIANCNTAFGAAVPKDQGMIAGQGLYNASDNVVILNAANFKSSVYGNTKAWLVEFYNSWCGFCFRFAPTWKTLATDVSSWRDIVVVAAIDCADDDNNSICREYEIMHYPMLKYFSVKAHPSTLGIVVEKGETVENVRHNLIDRLEKEQQEGRGSTWPNITPYRNVETTDIWKAVSNDVKYFFFIFESADSRLGTEVILDMHKVKSLQIRRVTSDNELLCVMNKITKFPSLIVLGRNETQKLLSIKIPTREGIRRTITEYMASAGLNVDREATMVSHAGETKLQDDIVRTTKQLETTQEQTDSDIPEDHLFQLDLENTLRYSLNHEIPLSKLIEGEKFEALKAYLNVLAAYFPLRQSGAFLEIIRDVVKRKDNITGERFRQLIRSAELEMSPVYSGAPQWIGCKGSEERFRGYPCGLWTMFHMLTVNFAIQKKDNGWYDPTEVLRAMHGYIKNFFGCADCSRHFVEMASRNKIFEIPNMDENILWLWRSHNEVNARLSGDDTEDPVYRKVQYPSSRQCSVCKYRNGNWNEENVLQYLKQKYSYAGIDYYGSSEKHRNESSDKSKIREQRLVSNKYTTLRKLGWDFTIFDISICVVLYVTSAAILILVCIKFAVKRSYKKKGYVNLLGKV